MTTPITTEGLHQFDHLPAAGVAYEAWVEAGWNAAWHVKMRARVRLEMPLVARALDRLAAEHGQFVCPRCEAVSAHPQDVEHGYCGRCHAFTSLPHRPGRGTDGA